MNQGATAIASAMAEASASDQGAQAFTRATAEAYVSGQSGFAEAYGSALATCAKSDVHAAAKIIEQSSEGVHLAGCRIDEASLAVCIWAAFPARSSSLCFSQQALSSCCGAKQQYI